MPTIREVYPYLIVRGATAAIEFYFERHALFTDDDGVVVHAEMRLGPGIMMIGSAPECDEGFNVYVYVKEVEAHYEHARAAGAEITRPLAHSGYGTREYGARDLDGHFWYFGTYLPAEID